MIEKHKKEEERLWLVNSILMLMDTIRDGIYSVDMDDRCTFINMAGANMIGYRPDELTGISIHSLLHYKYADGSPYPLEDCPIFKALKTGQSTHVEADVFWRRDGTSFPVEYHSCPIVEDDATRGAVVAFKDVTALKRADEEKRNAMQNLVDRINKLTAFYTAASIIRKEPSTGDMLKGIMELLSSAWKYPDIAAARIKYDDMCFKTPNYRETPWRQSASFNTVDGKRGTIEVVYLEDRPKEAEGPFLAEERGFIDAISEMIRIYLDRMIARDAMQNAREEAEFYVDLMGHDINNMNQVALGYLEMARNELKLKESEHKFLDKPIEILRNSSQLIDCVRKILIAKAGEIRLESVDLGKILDSVRIGYLNVPGREVIINYTPVEGCFAYANELLKDVFSNLVGNSIKHSSGPLTINIKVARVQEGGKNYFRVDVEDNGPGVPVEMRPHLFTRLPRRGKTMGRGLGLYLVKSLVEDFHGKVWMEDRVSGEPKRGSRFVVMLPAIS